MAGTLPPDFDPVTGRFKSYPRNRRRRKQPQTPQGQSPQSQPPQSQPRSTTSQRRPVTSARPAQDSGLNVSRIRNNGSPPPPSGRFSNIGCLIVVALAIMVWITFPENNEPKQVAVDPYEVEYYRPEPKCEPRETTPSYPLYRVTAQKLNVRAMPTTRADIIRTLGKDDVIAVGAITENGFARIVTKYGVCLGYVSTSYIEKIEQPISDYQPAAYTTPQSNSRPPSSYYDDDDDEYDEDDDEYDDEDEDEEDEDY